MKITWQVNDGYCGKSRSRVTIIDDGELEEYETEEERQDIIDDCIREEFESSITWSIISKEV